MNCPECGKELKRIEVTYDYSIDYSEEQSEWVKSIGEVVYSCGNCEETLSVRDIEDILKQVDEL